jgi:hypothetical protein
MASVLNSDPRKKLAYDESVRALQLQSSVLDELRSRTGILLAALALSASFLGARALDSEGLSALAWAAIACFSVSGLCCLGILWPSKGWSFTSDATVILDQWVHSPDEPSLDDMYEKFARWNQEEWKRNERSYLVPMQWALRAAVLFLIAQVALWLIALG